MNKQTDNSFNETIFIQEDESSGSSSLHLEIAIEPDFIQLTGFDFIKNRFNCFERIDFGSSLNWNEEKAIATLKTALQSSKLLALSPHFARASFYTHKSSFYPSQHISNAHIQKELEKLHGIDSSYLAEKSEIKNTEIEEIYAINTACKQTIAAFPAIRQVLSSKGLFLELSYLLQRRLAEDILFIDFTYHRLNLCLFSNNKLLLINSFSIQTALDVAYYSLYAAENSPVNLDKLQTLVAGPENWRKEVLGYFETYLPQSKAFIPAPFFETHATLAPHYENNFYFFNQLLCG